MQAIALAFPQRQLTVDVLHHDDGAIDDDTEIDGSNRKQIGGAIVGMKDDESEQQSERNGERGNNGRANADQKENQDDQYKDHAMEQIVLHGVGGELYEVAAVIVCIDFDVFGQYALVQFLGLRFHSLEHILRLLSRASE